jgi:uncharacterized protein
MIDKSAKLWEAIEQNRIPIVESLIKEGVSLNSRDFSGLTPLMFAAGRADAKMVRLLLDAGADACAVDSRAGASVLHKACQGGNLEVVQMLVEAGAFVDSVAPTTGHTPLMDALWFKYPSIVQYLLDMGAGLNLSTHYGFSLRQHFEYELNVNTIGRERLLQAEQMLAERIRSDEAKIQSQKLMAAVNNNDVAAVKELLQLGVNVEERFPIVNGFNDAHTPLLVAARNGLVEIVGELLRANADVNAIEPVFGAVPLHKCVYNGHVEITRMLVEHPKIDLNFQGATNGYTPLHDAIWHGYAGCAEILIEAGSRLDLQGHDGKTPLVLATEVFGANAAIPQLIKSKLKLKDN